MVIFFVPWDSVVFFRWETGDTGTQAKGFRSYYDDLIDIKTH